MNHHLKHLLLLITLIASTLLVGAQNMPHYGSSEDDMANSIFEYNNNFFICGTTRANNKSPMNYYILRLNENGSIKDEFVFGGEHRDDGRHILVDDKGIYVLGKTWDGGYPNNDMLLTKLNFDGQQIWKKYYGGSHNDMGHKFIFTKDGGFALTGFNRTYRSGNDFGDISLLKTNKKGELIWENYFGSQYIDHGFDLIENNKEEIIVAGTVGGFFNPTSTDYLNHDADIFIVKTNAAGEEVWSNTYGGTGHDWAKGIIAAPGGGYFICGSTQSEGAGSFDIFLMKIDDNGTKEWFKTYGGADFEYGEAIKATGNMLYILGTSASFSDNQKPDHILIQTNLEGEVIWQNTYGGEGSDYSGALTCVQDSACVFTGWTSLGTSGKKDIVLYKISKDGAEQLVSVIPPINDSIEQITVFPNPANNVFKILIDTKIKSDFQITIYNMQGTKVYNGLVVPNTNSLHRINLAAGMFLYTIEQNNSVVYSGKLVFN